MAVTIYEHYNFTGHVGYFLDHAYTPDLSNYAMGYYGDTWNNDISSLYTSTPLFVYEDTYYGGDYAILGPGFHDLDSLSAHGIENDDIGSFYAAPA
jgi:Peptidase inhibitor family I36